jgi:hypothetical protein
MCFKKAKLPEKTEEDIEIEKELEEARLARKREIRYELREEKDAQTESAYARALGMVGNRSLISGPKGGAGYMGAATGRVVTAPSRSSGGGGGIAPSAPATAFPQPGGGSGGSSPVYSGGGSGGLGSSYRSSSLIAY